MEWEVLKWNLKSVWDHENKQGQNKYNECGFEIELKTDWT